MFATALPLDAAPRLSHKLQCNFDDLDQVLKDLKKAEDNDTCSMGSTFMSSNAREEEIDDMTGWTEQFNLPQAPIMKQKSNSFVVFSRTQSMVAEPKEKAAKLPSITISLKKQPAPV